MYLSCSLLKPACVSASFDILSKPELKPVSNFKVPEETLLSQRKKGHKKSRRGRAERVQDIEEIDGVEDFIKRVSKIETERLIRREGREESIKKQIREGTKEETKRQQRPFVMEV